MICSLEKQLTFEEQEERFERHLKVVAKLKFMFHDFRCHGHMMGREEEFKSLLKECSDYQKEHTKKWQTERGFR